MNKSDACSLEFSLRIPNVNHRLKAFITSCTNPQFHEVLLFTTGQIARKNAPL